MPKESSPDKSRDHYTVGKGKPPVEHQKKGIHKNWKGFSTTNQPSPNMRSIAWQRRKNAIKMFDEIVRMSELEQKAFMKLKADVLKKPHKYSLRTVITMNYVEKVLNSPSFLKDWVSRNIPKPQSIELTGGDGEELKPTQVSINNFDKLTTEQLQRLATGKGLEGDFTEADSD